MRRSMTHNNQQVWDVVKRKERIKYITHCSANASITLRQPSSDMAATCLTSGENAKSKWKIRQTYKLPDKPRTHNGTLTQPPMADGIFGISSISSYTPIRVGFGMPWGYSNVYGR